MSSVTPADIKEDSSKFRPYDGASNDAAFFHIVLEPLLPVIRPLMSAVHSIRWELARPLDTRVLPRCVPYIGGFAPLHEANFITYGQVLLALPLVALVLGGYYLTFVSPDVEGSGKLAGYALIAVFMTASKSNSIFSFLLGISFERLIQYHNLSSLVAVTLSIFHGYVPFAYGDGDGGDDGGVGGSSDDRRLSSDDGGDSQYSLNGSDPNLLKFLFDGGENMSGTILGLSMVLLVLTSIFPIFRRKFFDLWFWIHIALAISVVVFSVMHELGAIVFIFGLWWALDVMMRYLIMATCRYPRKAQLELITRDVVKVSFVKPKNFSYNAGQFVQVAFPDLGLFAFHPISISSSPHEEIVTLHVRALGNWSKRLVKLSKKKSEVSILIEGPYGCVSIDVDNDDRYQMALFVGGGIGVTHCQSVAKSVLNERKRGRKLKQLRFVWAMRDLEMLKVMEPLECSKDWLDIMVDENESGTSMDDFVKTDVFLTKASPNSPTTLADGRRVYYGRPNLKAIIEDVEANAKKLGVTHVAVFGCGPKALINQLQQLCRSHSSSLAEFNKKGVQFDVHEEIFDF